MHRPRVAPGHSASSSGAFGSASESILKEVQYVGFDAMLPGLDTLSSTLRVIDGLIEA